jgi:hypothetical protein
MKKEAFQTWYGRRSEQDGHDFEFVCCGKIVALSQAAEYVLFKDAHKEIQ